MKAVAELLLGMMEAGVIDDYAVFGAVAQMRYTEAVATFDADILVSVPSSEGLELLGGIYQFCLDRGFVPEGEAIRVDDWPVQFIPAFDSLTTAAMQAAETSDVDGVPLRVIRADYLCVIALSVGRAKDMARVLALLEAEAVQEEDIVRIATEHRLLDKWTAFKEKFLET